MLRSEDVVMMKGSSPRRQADWGAGRVLSLQTSRLPLACVRCWREVEGGGEEEDGEGGAEREEGEEGEEGKGGEERGLRWPATCLRYCHTVTCPCITTSWKLLGKKSVGFRKQDTLQSTRIPCLVLGELGCLSGSLIPASRLHNMSLSKVEGSSECVL